jgi:hypothetical protein
VVADFMNPRQPPIIPAVSLGCGGLMNPLRGLVQHCTKVSAHGPLQQAPNAADSAKNRTIVAAQQQQRRWVSVVKAYRTSACSTRVLGAGGRGDAWAMHVSVTFLLHAFARLCRGWVHLCLLS